MTTKLNARTALEKNVARWITARTADYDGNTEAVLHDLFYGGCQSGMVGHLIYYKDTLSFYRKHQKEIDAMLAEVCDESGCTPAELFGEKWDASDPLARDTMNKNLLAWFGFEETARNLANAAGLDF